MSTSISKAVFALVSAAICMTLGIPAEAAKPTKPGGGSGAGSGSSCSLLGASPSSTSPDPISVVREVYSYKRSGARIYQRQDFYLQSADGSCSLLVASTAAAVSDTGRPSFHFKRSAGKARLAWGERTGSAYTPTIRLAEVATDSNGIVTTALPVTPLTLVSSTDFGANAPHVAFARDGTRLAFTLGDSRVSQSRVNLIEVGPCAADPTSCTSTRVGGLEGGLLGAELSWSQDGRRIYSGGRCDGVGTPCTQALTTDPVRLDCGRSNGSSCWAVFYWAASNGTWSTPKLVLSERDPAYQGAGETDVGNTGAGDLLAATGGQIYDVDACVSSEGEAACRVRDIDQDLSDGPWYPKWANHCASGAKTCLYYSVGVYQSPSLVEFPTEAGSPASWSCHVPAGSAACAVVATGNYFDAAY